MAAADVQQPPAEPAPGVPDYLASPNAVLGDSEAKWRYGRAPDYSKTRKVYQETKKMDHTAGSLPQLVENLVKNWEVEASFKTQLSDWRTIDHENYSFAINGGPPQTGEHMLKVGTYNAIIAPNEYYSPENSDFASSHKTFKRMMPTFAWEVIEVYSGPPKVSFKWRHWGTMKNDYVGFNDKGEKITAKAHGGLIDITGITIATVDDKVRLQAVDTYFDPLDMFRQIAPNGIVNKQVIDSKTHSVDKAAALDDPIPANDGAKIGEQHNTPGTEHSNDAAPKSVSDASEPIKSDSEAGQTVSSNDTAQGIVETAASQGADVQTEKVESNAAANTSSSSCPVTGHSRSNSSGNVWEKMSNPAEEVGRSNYSSSVTGDVAQHLKAGLNGEYTDDSTAAGVHDEVDEHLEKSASVVHPHPKIMEEAVKPEAGEAVAVQPHTEETRMTHEEMSNITPAECPFLMNRE